MPLRAIALTLLMVLGSAVASGQSVPSFAGPVSYNPGPNAFGAAVQLIDLDGDGRDDLFESALTLPVSFRYRLSNPNGSLGPLFQIPPIALGEVLDVNDAGDGTPEIVTYLSAPCLAPAVTGLLNSGRTCTQGPGLSLAPFGVPLPCSGSSAQLHSATRSGSVMHAALVPPGGSGIPTIQAYDFQLPTLPGSQPTITPVGSPYSLAAPIPSAFGMRPYTADLDGDGTPDLAVRTHAFLTSTTFELVLSTAGGFVPNAPTPFITSVAFGGPASMFAQDFSGDGRDELLISNSNGVTLHANHGLQPGGGILLQPSLSLPGFYAWAIDDIDGDGDPDVIGSTPGQIRFLLNDGSGALMLSPSFLTNAGPGQLDAGDLDGDGDVDIATGSAGSAITVYLNQLVPSVVALPGTADAIGLGSAVHPAGSLPAAFTTAPFFDFKNAVGGDGISCMLTAAAFAGAQAYFVVEPFPTGCPPAFPWRKVYASGTAATMVSGPHVVPAGGVLTMSFALPPFVGPQNQSALCQFVILDPAAYNGQYAATEGHEIQF